MKHKLLTLFILFALLLTFLPAQAVHAAGDILYVDDDSTCIALCGGSWATAYPSLQTALFAARSGNQIWVAEGVYLPSTTNQASTFTLRNNIAIYGGFSGSEDRLDQRDIAANPTILSGDIDQNDTNTDGNFIAETSADIQGNNTHHVVTGSGTDNTAVLDGFIVTAGQANIPSTDDSGGGMFNSDGNPSLISITFSGNSASLYGGGMHNDNSSPILTNVTFSGNKAAYGGGLNNKNSNPTLTNVTFNSNIAILSGGGMRNLGDGSPNLMNVTFNSNTAINGGGMYNSGTSTPTLTGVTFGENSADYGGGMYNWANSPVMVDVTFTSNVAAIHGGGMYNQENGNPSLTDVTFTGNTSEDKGGGMYNDDSNPALTNVTFDDNMANTSGGGVYNQLGNPILTNVTFNSNMASWGGGMNNSLSNPTLTNVTFTSNAANYGAGMYNDNSSPALTNVTFSQNSASWGGGMCNTSSNPILTNVTFSQNSADNGGGMYNETSAPTLTNVTFNLNDGNTSTGGVYNSDSSPTIRNTILWGNYSPDSLQIMNVGSSAPIISDSVIQGGYAGGADIITSDPLLGTLGNYGGFTQTIPLQAGSSAIDTGSDIVCPASDQRGVSRPQGAGCDIGAYEYEVAFTKSAPANGATGHTLSPTLSWNQLIGATSYEYCYSSVPGPCTQWHSVGANTSVTLSGLAPNYTYYWQVRAVDAGGTAEANDGAWWSFTTTTAPACTWPAYTPPAAPTFGDVPMTAGHWSWVERLANSTITAGCGSGNYCPFSDVVRAQMAIFLLRGKHCGSAYTPPAVGDSTGFGDVPLSASYAPWVKQLAAEGITAGCGGGNFCPLQVVNRAQMAIFLLRAKHGSTYSPPAVGATTGFGDVPLDASYAAWVKQLAAEGITAGCGGGNFCPLQNVNRAQMATFLVRAFGLP